MTAPRWESLPDHLRALHAAALRAVEPAAAVRRALRLEGDRLRVGDRTLPLPPGAALRIVAMGKAAPAMARGAWEVLGERAGNAVVAYPAGHDPGEGWPPRFRLVAAEHPLPGDGSLAAGAAALDLVLGGRPDDLLLALVSGGGSALLEAPVAGVALDDLRALTLALQRSGADIRELNTVRRALSRIKGGGLARAARPARVATLVLSDVVGDDPAVVASGPTAGVPASAADALAVLERWKLDGLHPAIVRALRLPPSDSGAPPRCDDEDVAVVVGANRLATEAVLAAAEGLGFAATLATEPLRGEAREAGAILGCWAREIRASAGPDVAACRVAGGETTVTVRGGGVGGRNQELALGAALALEGTPRSALLAFATDGVDGPTGAAGGVVTGETVARARAAGLSVRRALGENDSWTLLRALGDLWESGPTGTNVNDVAIALVYPATCGDRGAS